LQQTWRKSKPRTAAKEEALYEGLKNGLESGLRRASAALHSEGIKKDLSRA